MRDMSGIQKPIFNPEVTWGHVLMTIGLLVPILIFGFSLKADVNFQNKLLDKHDRIIEKLVETQNELSKTQALLNQRIDLTLRQLNKQP